ncbi:MAG TPA: methyltransferase domain-containing protein [Azospira sp.]|nr:methyltransferase domain-containing protein [Azospira sp.]
MKRLNVGCGRNVLPDWINLDCAARPGVDLVADLELCATTPLPLADDSVDEFLLQHVLEHIRNPLPLMQELHRVARPGALAVVRTPYGSSDDAWEDQTHVRPYFVGSFGYFSQPFYWRADYGYRGDWQVERIVLLIPRGRVQGLSAEAAMALVHRERNVVAEMHAELRAVKPLRQALRELQQAPRLEIELVDL